MMTGTVAQPLNRLGGGGIPWLPAGATAFLDFVNGSYYAGGTPRSVTDILGGGFDPSSISASGMLISFPNGNRPSAIGALFSDLAAGLAAGCTVIFEVNHANSPYGHYLYFLNAASESVASQFVRLSVQNVIEAAMIGDATEIWLEGAAGSLSGTGIHKVAATFNRSNGGSNEYALSSNGETAVTYSVAYAPFSPVNTILIGHDGDDSKMLDNAYIRTITLYPALTPAELPALSV